MALKFALICSGITFGAVAALEYGIYKTFHNRPDLHLSFGSVLGFATVIIGGLATARAYRIPSRETRIAPNYRRERINEESIERNIRGEEIYRKTINYRERDGYINATENEIRRDDDGRIIYRARRRLRRRH